MAKMHKIEKGIEIEIIVPEALEAHAKVGFASDLEMIMTDSAGEMYEANVFMKEGWTPQELTDIVQASCMLCDGPVVKCKATFKGKPLLN